MNRHHITVKRRSMKRENANKKAKNIKQVNKKYVVLLPTLRFEWGGTTHNLTHLIYDHFPKKYRKIRFVCTQKLLCQSKPATTYFCHLNFFLLMYFSRSFVLVPKFYRSLTCHQGKTRFTYFTTISGTYAWTNMRRADTTHTSKL